MSQDELKQKIREFFETYAFSNLITIDADGIPKGRMMENVPLEDDLVFYFATFAQSNKVAEIKANPNASVFLYRPEDHSSISVLGTAAVVTDDAIRKAKWKEKWAGFWQEGPTDPSYVLISVTPGRILYNDYPNHASETLEL
ncbi:MAG: pyridoxamine 5'-phosphate oxidase family protein [Deltaproteobacteria bacterium]|nr:pyridoxamine 5'-phosphate oxidase family protein [Deltaproteobacteria bacterium]